MKVQTVQYAWQDPRLKDFKNFLFLAWRHLGLPDPTPLQYDVADVLQKAILAGNSRLIVMGFRGMAKSWISSVLCLWVLYWWPDENILVESAAKPRADEFSTFCLRLIDEIDWLEPLRPTDSQRRRVDSFEVGPAGASHSPSLRAVGITGQRTGARAGLIVGDDVEVDSNSDTDIQRERLRHSCLENEAIVKPGTGTVIYLGTPHTEQTVYKVLEAAGYTIVIWPARYPDARLQRVYGSRLAPLIAQRLKADPSLVGQPTEPTRFPESDLQMREAKGRSWFALQYMLDTSLSDALRYPLRLSDLVVDDLDVRMGSGGYVWSAAPEFELKGVPSPGLDGDRFHRPLQRIGNPAPYQGVIVQVDPAGTGGDELAACAVGMLNGNVYLFEVLGLRGGYTEENLTKIAQLARFWGAQLCRVESNMGDGMFAKLLEPYLLKIHPCGIEDNRTTLRKEKRIIAALEPLMNQHRFIVNTKVVHWDAERRAEDGDLGQSYSLFHQMTRLTKEPGSLRHDDRLDCVAMAVEYWAAHLGVDQEMALERSNLEAAQREYEEALRLLGPDAFKDPRKVKPGPKGFADRVRDRRNTKVDPRTLARDRQLGRLPRPKRKGPITIGVPVWRDPPA